MVILCWFAFFIGGFIGILIGIGYAQHRDDSHGLGYVVVWRRRDDNSTERLGAFSYRGVLREIKWEGSLCSDIPENSDSEIK